MSAETVCFEWDLLTTDVMRLQLPKGLSSLRSIPLRHPPLLHSTTLRTAQLRRDHLPTGADGTRARRKPRMLDLRFDGVFALRIAARQPTP